MTSKSVLKRLAIPVLVNGDTLWSDAARTVVADSPRGVAEKLKALAERNRGNCNEGALSA